MLLLSHLGRRLILFRFGWFRGLSGGLLPFDMGVVHKILFDYPKNVVCVRLSGLQLFLGGAFLGGKQVWI